MIVIGGGDTGTDCIGTSVRHGAKQARSPVLAHLTTLPSMYKPCRGACSGLSSSLELVGAWCCLAESGVTRLVLVYQLVCSI